MIRRVFQQGWGARRRSPILETGRWVAMRDDGIRNSVGIGKDVFSFHFEHFSESARDGTFVRPALSFWSGRPGVERRRFARAPDIARADLVAEQRAKAGRFRGLPGRSDLLGLVSTLAVTVPLRVAKQARKAIPFGGARPRWLRGGSDAEKPRAAISETQGKAGKALAQVKDAQRVNLCRDAGRGPRDGRPWGVGYDAWPMPACVTHHLVQPQRVAP
ncbi:MAG: hypothetical protein AAFY65_12580 [Pseudomonadota bacterium]